MSSPCYRREVLTKTKLKRELKRNKFLILVFYRTSWCGRYINDLMEFHKDIQDLGGKVIAVSTQSVEATEQQMLDWRLTCDSYCDISKKLSRKYDMLVENSSGSSEGEEVEKKPRFFNKISCNSLLTRKSSPCTKRFSMKKLARKSVKSLGTIRRSIKSLTMKSDRFSQLSSDGYVMPGIVILTSKKVVFKWKGVIAYNSFLATFTHIEPNHVLTIARLHFDSSISSSNLQLNKECSDALFDYVMQVPEMTILFEQFLRSEYSSELLEFVKEVEYARETCQNGDHLYPIYSKYIIGKRQVNLDSKTVYRLLKAFSRDNIDDLTVSIFDEALIQVKLVLRSDPFRRFLQQSCINIARLNPAFFIYNSINNTGR